MMTDPEVILANDSGDYTTDEIRQLMLNTVNTLEKERQ